VREPDKRNESSKEREPQVENEPKKQMLQEEKTKIRLDALRNSVKAGQKITGIKRAAIKRLLPALDSDAIDMAYAIAVDRNNHIR
tara:strand:- start:2529 stop:2783 length:255 start_codon:yes stop_codon:yes gene_type:complete